MQNSECKRPGAIVGSSWRRWLALPAFCILHSALLVSLTACGAKAKAQTLPDGPPLAVPGAPAHEIVIEQVAEAPPPEPEPVPEPVAPARPAVTTRTQTRPQTPRVETPAATQPTVAPQPTPDPPVRAAPAAAAGDEKKAKELIARATDLLDNKVDYKRLSAEGRQQYEQSKRFRDQADQAMKDRNLLLAVTLADKAATLAAELVR